ncbi:serine hydrolase [Parvularcula sp. IMCC14364]|uniref:serine hydrolase domain-containing protein n=1 Tax=Parvularcula sp. IMCC14364 TaxID=3067902 RepID=UPI002741744F|nr:serine hydrolase domain-containing protein [Parvularcula sp. IMCC14364]
MGRWCYLIILSVLYTISPSHANDDIQRQLDAGLSGARDAEGLVGAGAIIVRNGTVVALSVDGVRRNGKPDLIEQNDKWHLGSVTKSMTGVLIGLLVDEGKVSFSQTLPQLLPDLANEMDAGWQRVTLHHLMTHTAGMPGNFPLSAKLKWPETHEEARLERRKVFAAMLAKAPATPPGEKFQYSNAGISLAGHIAESVTDIPYETLMLEKVFQPLGLESAGFGAPDGDNPWSHASRFFIKMAMNPADGADNTPLMSPAGRAHMSLQDLAIYGQLHLDGYQGRSDFLMQDTWDILHTPVLDEYAHGIGIMERKWAGGTLIWHNGTNTMWYALLLVFPEAETVMAFTSNDGKFREAEQAYFNLARDMMTYMQQHSEEE